MPIKGSAKGSALMDMAVRGSLSIVLAIKSAPKYNGIADKKAMATVRKIAVFKILRQLFLLPNANSSANNRVTAVEIPLVAKVDAKT